MSEPHIPATLEDRIRQRIKDLGLNPLSAAKKAGLKDGYVHDILRGKVKNPTAEKLAKLADALECTLPWLVSGDDEAPVIKKWTGEIQAPAPKPAMAWAEAGRKLPVLLEIRHELMGNAWRDARDASPPVLGLEAATIPSAYAGRESWFELMRDDSMDEFVPPGSLVQVVALQEGELATLQHGDLIVVVRRLIAPDRSFHLVERSLRFLNLRYPDLGLWFADYRSRNEEWPYDLDDIIRVDERDPNTGAITARDDLGWALQEPDPTVEVNNKAWSSWGQLEGRTKEELAEIVKSVRSQRARAVAKAIRLIAPLHYTGRFGLTTEGR